MAGKGEGGEGVPGVRGEEVEGAAGGAHTEARGAGGRGRGRGNSGQTAAGVRGETGMEQEWGCIYFRAQSCLPVQFPVLVPAVHIAVMRPTEDLEVTPLLAMPTLTLNDIIGEVATGGWREAGAADSDTG